MSPYWALLLLLVFVSNSGRALGKFEVQRPGIGHFEYRADGLPIVYESGPTRVQYYYDALDRLVAKVTYVEGVQIQAENFTYIADTNELLISKNGDGQTTTYISGNTPEEHLGEVRNGVAKSYVTDHLGSVLNSDAAGGFSRYGYFGETTEPVNSSPDQSAAMFGFAGMVYEPESGKYRTENRLYDPETGRFLSPEPTGADGPNLYWYAKNNPLKYVDPTGLGAKTITEGASSIQDASGVRMMVRSFRSSADLNGVASPWEVAQRSREEGLTAGSGAAAAAEHYLYAYESVRAGGIKQARLMTRLIPAYQSLKALEQSTGCRLVTNDRTTAPSFLQYGFGYMGILDALTGN